MFLRRRPSAHAVEAFVTASRRLPLSYDPVGLARGNPAGFAVDELVAIIGHGQAAFDTARTALFEWRHFEFGWVELFPRSASTAPGTDVVILVRHLGFWSMNGCRVVYSVGGAEEREAGFAYGTLTNHTESGEEIFTVSFRPDTGEVSYSIRAASRPRAALARLGYPVTRLLQARFRRDSARAMARAVASRLH